MTPGTGALLALLLGIYLLVAWVLVRLARIGQALDRTSRDRRVVRVLSKRFQSSALETRRQVERLQRMVREVRQREEDAASRDQQFRRGLVAELAAETDEHRRQLSELRAHNTSLEEQIRGTRAELKAAQDAVYRVLREVQALPKNVELLHQFESTLELRTRFSVAGTLPLTGGWAAAPTTLLRLLKEIQDLEAKTVVECGSGVSTLYVAYMLSQMGEGHCFAFEHDVRFGQETQQLVAQHGLSDWASIRQAPLVETAHGLWYDLDSLHGVSDIDVVFVDGPPKATGPLARRPALAALAPYLKPGAVILLDDSSRDDEQEIVQDWLKSGMVRLKASSNEHKGWAALEFVGIGEVQS